MSMREVRVYDGNFPTMEQVLSGDPAARFPKEIWQAEVRPGEFAVRYKDFKTGLARSPSGVPVRSSEVCRIFTTFACMLLGILAWYMRIQFVAKRQVSTLRNRLDSTLSAEEKRRFEELNTLFGLSDPAERQRFLKLAAEYQTKIREALK